MFSVIINRLRGGMEAEVPRIFGAVFECTLQMITRNFEDYPEHRLQFFSLLRAITNHCSPTLFAMSQVGGGMLGRAVVVTAGHGFRDPLKGGGSWWRCRVESLLGKEGSSMAKPVCVVTKQKLLASPCCAPTSSVRCLPPPLPPPVPPRRPSSSWSLTQLCGPSGTRNATLQTRVGGVEGAGGAEGG